MTILFKDNFTGSGGVYGRFADEVNCFDSGLSWSEDQDKGYVADGHLRTTEETYSGYYRAWVSVSDYGTTATYIDENDDPQTLDIDSDAHEIRLSVTRMTSDNHQCTARWVDSSGAFVGEQVVSVDSTIGVPVNVLISIPSASGVGRYEIDYGLGTGVDYFAITTPGHVDEPPIADPGPTTGMGWVRLINCAEL